MQTKSQGQTPTCLFSLSSLMWDMRESEFPFGGFTRAHLEAG